MCLAKAGSARVKLTTISIRLKEFDNAECRHSHTFVPCSTWAGFSPISEREFQTFLVKTPGA